MEDFTSELEAARERVQEQFENARARHARLRVALDALEDATATARSSRGEVIVAAGTDGSIRSVTIADPAPEPRVLGPLITRTIAEAQQAARALVDEAMGASAGGA